MDENIYEALGSNIKKLAEHPDQKAVKKLDLKQLDRIVLRLEKFAGDCTVCEEYLMQLEDDTRQLSEEQGVYDKELVGSHKKLMESIISHLEKKHKLIREGHNVSIFMLVGISLGIIYSVVFDKDYSSGISYGMIFGLLLGSALDENARRKGQVI